MSRIVGSRVKEIGDEIYGQCIDNANVLMDDVMDQARRICPKGSITREGGFVRRIVVINPKATSKGKGGYRVRDRQRVFEANTWLGRVPGSLRASIRRVNSLRKPGSIRVYAGHYKVFYAFMVERGTVKTNPQPFMRPAFAAAKPRILNVLKNGSL